MFDGKKFTSQKLFLSIQWFFHNLFPFPTWYCISCTELSSLLTCILVWHCLSEGATDYNVGRGQPDHQRGHYYTKLENVCHESLQKTGSKGSCQLGLEVDTWTFCLNEDPTKANRKHQGDRWIVTSDRILPVLNKTKLKGMTTISKCHFLRTSWLEFLHPVLVQSETVIKRCKLRGKTLACFTKIL